MSLSLLVSLPAAGRTVDVLFLVDAPLLAGFEFCPGVSQGDDAVQDGLAWLVVDRVGAKVTQPFELAGTATAHVCNRGFHHRLNSLERERVQVQEEVIGRARLRMGKQPVVKPYFRGDGVRD